MEGFPSIVNAVFPPRRLAALILLALTLSACGSFEVIVPTQRPDERPTATRLIVTRPPRTLESAPTETPRSARVQNMTAIPTRRLESATPRPSRTPVRTTAPTTAPKRDSDTTYPAMPRNLTEGRVTRVVDGDTFDVRVDGETHRVRLIGINTPESVDPRRPVQCFGLEASKRAKELLNGKTVFLEEDPSQDSVDQFGRWLRFVWFSDGRLYNLQMIAEGYAYEYTYDVAYKYQSQFRDAQRTAERADRGLWSPKTCNGQR